MPKLPKIRLDPCFRGGSTTRDVGTPVLCEFCNLGQRCKPQFRAAARIFYGKASRIATDAIVASKPTRAEGEILAEAFPIGCIVEFDGVVVVGEDASVLRIRLAGAGVGVLNEG